MTKTYVVDIHKKPSKLCFWEKLEIFIWSYVSGIQLFFCLALWRLTLVLLNPDIPCFANSVDPDQLEANWSGSALFAIKYVNL